MPPATGFQVLFLTFAMQFAAMLAAAKIAKVHPMSPQAYEVLGQAIFFALATTFLVSVGSVRRFCVTELSRKIPRGAFGELSLVTLAKAAIPFAVIGAVALWAWATGDLARLAARWRDTDPDGEWAWVLSSIGFVRMIAFSWIIGPIVEELLFRGLMYRAWERQFGWLASLALVSVSFSLFHNFGTASPLIGSIVYICVLRRTGSIRASIAVHMAYNFLVSWPLLGRLLWVSMQAEPARISAWSVPLACLVLAVVAVPAYLLASRSDVRSAKAA